jgi:hypothetical protein
MPNEFPPNDVRNLWQSQKGEPVKMSLEEIRSKSRKYQRMIRLRNSIEYAALSAVVLFFAFSIGRRPETLMSLGSGLCIAGGLSVAWQLHKRGSAKPVPADLGVASCIAFHRKELERQRDFFRGSLRWYLGPLIPGLAVIVAAGALANPGRLAHPKLFVGGYAIVTAAAFFAVWRYHQRCARRLQSRIDDLAAAERQ